jgi:hypothetical protein
MLNPSDNSPEHQYRLQSQKPLIHKYPLAFWGGLWVVVILVGSVATIGLFNPGPIDQGASVPTSNLGTIQEATPKSTAREVSSFSLFGGVALGCAMGSLLVTHFLRHATGRRQTTKRLKPVTAARKKRRRPSQRSHPVASHPMPRASESALNTQDNQLTQVTVLPAQESHPLDGGKESLAEMLDLRKRKSLASLMRDP